MGLPSYSALSSTQFRVGFGPRGIQQRLILTEIHFDRIAGCDDHAGRVVVEPDSSVERGGIITEASDGRIKKVFKIPWQLRSEDDVQRATREVLFHANGKFANRVAFTPLGMGDDGVLSPDQSARAMLGAIYALWAGEENKVPHQILISARSELAYQDFELALERHFFPYRQAENPNSGLHWKSAAARWGARNLRGKGQRLFQRLEDLSGDRGRDAAHAIHQIAQESPAIFKAKDVDRMSGYDSYDGIPETLLILRNQGGKLGEAARQALVNREKSAAMDVIRNEIELISEADGTDLAEAISIEREDFLETLAFEIAPMPLDSMCFGEGPESVRCRYESLWGKTAMFSWKDDGERVKPQFIQFHKAAAVTRSRMRNELFTMGMRIANREEATRLLMMIKIAVLSRYGSKANLGSHRMDGTQEWFLNLCAEYRNRPTDLDSDWHVGSLPENIGRGTLFLHFQNHAESDWDSHRALRILVEDFGLNFVSPRDD